MKALPRLTSPTVLKTLKNVLFNLYIASSVALYLGVAAWLLWKAGQKP